MPHAGISARTVARVIHRAEALFASYIRPADRDVLTTPMFAAGLHTSLLA